MEHPEIEALLIEDREDDAPERAVELPARPEQRGEALGDGRRVVLERPADWPPRGTECSPKFLVSSPPATPLF